VIGHIVSQRQRLQAMIDLVASESRS
jgi:hypothetical protein